MFLNDSFEIFFVAMSIPGSFGIHDGNGALRADAKAIRLRAKNGTVDINEFELFEPAFQELPGSFLLVGGRTISAHAKENMSPIVLEV